MCGLCLLETRAARERKMSLQCMQMETRKLCFAETFEVRAKVRLLGLKEDFMRCAKERLEDAKNEVDLGRFLSR